jgi:hypothetical protein
VGLFFCIFFAIPTAGIVLQMLAADSAWKAEWTQHRAELNTNLALWAAERNSPDWKPLELPTPQALPPPPVIDDPVARWARVVFVTLGLVPILALSCAITARLVGII